MTAITSPSTWSLRPAVAGFSHDVASASLNGKALDAKSVNSRLVELARNDLDDACLAWRQASNAERLAPHPLHRHVLEMMADGRLVATALHPEKTVAERVGRGWHLSARGLLTTGVGYASHVIVEATTKEGPTLFVVPASSITEVHRPSFVGLEASDNAVIALAGDVSNTAVLGEVGGAGAVIEQPYKAGLTMGAVAVGAVEAVLALLRAFAVDGTVDERSRLGTVLADVAASQALVEAVPHHAPRAAWWSRAAKLAATAAADRSCRTARTLLGPATYGAGHPLVRLDRGIEGLAYQAPTNRGAALGICAEMSEHLPSPEPNPELNNQRGAL